MKHSRPTRLVAAGLSAMAVCGCGAKHELSRMPATATPVVVSLAGPAGAVVAPLYAAGVLGDFTRAGLVVSLEASADGRQSLAKLASGAVTLAVASEPDVLVARATGAQIVSIATLEQGPLEALISIPPSRATTVAGLGGRTVAIGTKSVTGGTPFATAELDTMLRTAGVDAAGVHTIDAGADLGAPLKAGKADAGLGLWNVDAVALDLQRRKPTVIKIADAGVPTFNDVVIVARLTDARSHGELLRTFLQAVTQAVRAEQATPGTAVAALLAGVPGLNRRVEAASLAATLPALVPAGPTGGASPAKPFGYQDPAVWRTFAAWMLTNGLLTVHSDAALGVDNEFLPGQGE